MPKDGEGAICLEMEREMPGEKNPARRDLRRENERLRQMLAQTEEAAARYAIMLREGDHRIKNSLQIVASLMALQAGRESSNSAREALVAASARIQSIAWIHDALQAGGGDDLVNLDEILEKMCRSLHAMAGDPFKVAVRVNVEPVELPASRAQPIALAVNELVVNALRHAFPGHRAGSIWVDVKRVDDELHVAVTDDGRGLPPTYADGEGYGIKLVGMMVKQIGGMLHVGRRPGARFTLIAPIPEGDRRLREQTGRTTG